MDSLEAWTQAGIVEPRKNSCVYFSSPLLICYCAFIDIVHMNMLCLQMEGSQNVLKKLCLISIKNEWAKALQEEMKYLNENYTYDLVKLPKGNRALENKWVYRLKTENNLQQHYKTRLVVKGFDQKKYVDFEKIFSSVVKMSSIRVVMRLTASLNLEIEQLDVKLDIKTTFLHDDLKEEIYIEQPEGFSVKVKQELVCKLKKSSYRLKQALRQWYKKFDFFFIENHDFSKTMCDHCVFVKKW